LLPHSTERKYSCEIETVRSVLQWGSRPDKIRPIPYFFLWSKYLQEYYRIFYDDERMDDFKDDIRELEDAARRADLLADQARIQAEEADLRARMAAAEIDENDCSGFY
jgi:hypothetical protein